MGNRKCKAAEVVARKDIDAYIKKVSMLTAPRCCVCSADDARVVLALQRKQWEVKEEDEEGGYRMLLLGASNTGKSTILKTVAELSADYHENSQCVPWLCAIACNRSGNSGPHLHSLFAV